MANLYLVDSLEKAQAGSVCQLPEWESHHAVKVARLRIGESTILGDGKGRIAHAIVRELTSSAVVCEVESVNEFATPQPRLTLVQALTKGDRAERAIEACTELGIDRIIPWQAHRSISRWTSEKVEKGRQRWQTIVRESTKQCARAYLPEVESLADSSELVHRLAGALVVILEPEADLPLTQLGVSGDDVGDIALVIGPEGGISPEERAQFREAGFHERVLGKEILRTSTAATAATVALSIALNRW